MQLCEGTTLAFGTQKAPPRSIAQLAGPFRLKAGDAILMSWWAWSDAAHQCSSASTQSNCTLLLKASELWKGVVCFASVIRHSMRTNQSWPMLDLVYRTPLPQLFPTPDGLFSTAVQNITGNCTALPA